MKLPQISLDSYDLTLFDEAIKKEWLITNGLGGYASSTVLGLNTRKYHGLLVAALHPPGDRTVCVAKLDEEIYVGNEVQKLGVNEFSGVIYPKGYLFLKQFSVSPFPEFTYALQNVEVRKTIFMPKEKNVVAVIYRILNNGEKATLIRIFPFLTCRHFHSVIDRHNCYLSFNQQQKSSEFRIIFDVPKVAVVGRTTNGIFVEKPVWIERLYYREEANRGESSVDDCYQPGYFELEVPHGISEFSLTVAASTSLKESAAMLDAVGNKINDIKAQLALEIAWRKRLLANFYGEHSQVAPIDWLNWLLLAADAFIVKGSNRRTSVLAGYFWFETWGRDTFISLPGLLLVTGRFDDARSILLNFMAHLKRGLIPNYIEDKCGEAFYNTVDATLWYVNAVLKFLKYTGDLNFVQKHLWEGLKTIIYHYERGTDFNIHLDSDGLLAHGPRLTWMDAEVDGKAVTPRSGKAVEIQALWYNALRTMQRLAERFGEHGLAEKYAEMAQAAKKSFNEKFWNSENGFLFDVINESSRDGTLRPNQIIAIALDFAILDAGKRKSIADVTQQELLTPFGLRTLPRGDPRYQGMYVGDRRSRDRAYHNGTVWPWLLGPYVTAVHKIKGNSEHELQALLMPLFTQQLTQAGLGTLSEIFDGDPPHTPRGCIAQAWSIAEPLRAYVEDVLQIRPKHEKDFL